MKLKEVFNRAFRITLIPSHQWKVIRDEVISPRDMIVGYVFPLVSLAAVGRTIGLFISLYPILGLSLRMMTVLMYNLISWIVIPYIIIIAAIYLLDIILPRFGVETTLVQIIKLVVYTITPLFLLTFIVYIHPLMRILIPMGIYVYFVYTLYLYWYGLKELYPIPIEKKVRFILISIIVAVGAVVLLQFVYATTLNFIVPGLSVYVR